jgi:hypothetical protein
MDTDQQQARTGVQQTTSTPGVGGRSTGSTGNATFDGAGTITPPPAPPELLRFHGSVTVDPVRLGRDAGRIAEEVVQHLSTIVGANVEITLEIRADLPEGASEKLVRDVTENCRTLKFNDYGFEEA